MIELPELPEDPMTSEEILEAFVRLAEVDGLAHATLMFYREYKDERSLDEYLLRGMYVMARRCSMMMDALIKAKQCQTVSLEIPKEVN